ncbi:AtpZ/AtpI family protein [Marinobacter sp. LV10MA510-1]|uniref:AtpZ/AtpI family protein n=1 Tax=Marinobacter sp. LV10MA510-1 TaxID=1415567 RepID=UPI000BFA3FEF|nr:AtpZ/AtpI family protein [Marinobacter sp. LV10MA510-1]PFG10327.1 ATP synthase protein I [Marinobacter sp. LV10MA510-1]
MSSRKDRSADDIRRSTERLQRARKQPGASPLRGLGAFGMIGWSVAVPAVAGAFLGLWLNKVAPQNFSWPIALILGGIVVGAMIAWNWIDKETPKADGDNNHTDANEGDKHDG